MAAESGIDQVIQNFNPNSTLDQLALNGTYTTTCLTNPNPSTYNFQSIPNATDQDYKGCDLLSGTRLARPLSYPVIVLVGRTCVT